MVVRNEFAVVEVSVQERGGSTVLVIENATEGASIALDALELEALTRTSHETLRQLISATPPYTD
ncbi:MAG: dihydrodiol dehydrogenase [Candidatus Dormibacteraeota bacterium]|nr:dihydrodiol dehydrogenase [Candidatus Dormibacteraeota bacterium]